MDLSQLFGGVYAGARVLVTGHTGFKGSWLSLWLQTMGAQVSGIALAPETDPAHWTLLKLYDVRDFRLDVRDAYSVTRLISEIQPQIIFHLAAQPLVRRSYRDPVETFATNVMGLINLLEAVRACASVQVVINVTTDKVYLEQETPDGYSEEHPLGGHDPYSTSKACAELVSGCYRKSYFSGAGSLGPRVATARAGNVIGGGDWSEDRIVPDLVRARVANKSLRVRNPESVRPWQHVLEPLAGYLRLGQALLSERPVEGAWNFGPAGDTALSVSTLVARAGERWPTLHTEHDTNAQPHEAKHLRLESSKAQRELGWRPVWDAHNTIDRTIDWYRAFHERGDVLSSLDLNDYVADARSAQLDCTTHT